MVLYIPTIHILYCIHLEKFKIGNRDKLFAPNTNSKVVSKVHECLLAKLYILARSLIQYSTMKIRKDLQQYEEKEKYWENHVLIRTVRVYELTTLSKIVSFVQYSPLVENTS